MSTNPGNGVGGLRVTGMTLKNAADECLRLRYLVTGDEVHDNTITGNAGGGSTFMRSPQGPVCSNTVSGTTGGDAVGTYGSSYDPTGACPK
ncbi:hypothetical protein ACIQWZ_25430 [Streptomyces sp. NPDC098077]|uniref:hypothetical protein n=1 Tax=Streptomyces sp. NPDC098077 TaxID=3366093 RepID=UPI0038008232